ncbi:MAG: hypothetical protein WEF50_22950 [Myxococcota bacterium]
MSQPAPANPIEADSYVVNPKMREWGPGRVMQLEGAKAVVCFRDVRADAAGDGLKTMVLRALEASPMQSDAWLDNLPPFKNGKFQVAQPRVTFDEGTAELIRHFPLGFSDPAYAARECEAKRSAHALWTSTLADGQGEALLTEGDLAELVRRALAVVALAGVLNRVESAALRDGLADGATAKRAFSALFALLGAAEGADGLLAPYFEAMQPVAIRGKTAASRWTLATVLPFLARPDAFLILKPDVSKNAAERLRFDLVYHAEPNARTYEKLQRMASALLERLAPLGARDLIDVHAYLGEVARYGSSRAQA